IKFLQATNQITKAKNLIEKYHLFDESINKEDKSASNGFLSIFSTQYFLSTVLFSFIYIMAFLLIYGMNTWLPKIMQQAGYPMNSSLMFLLCFNLAAIIGGIIAGAAADRIRPKKVISFTYLLAALSIALLSIKFNIVIMYTLIAIAGFGTTGTTFVLASYVMKKYQSHNRATAIGVSSAIGRLGAVAGPIIVGIIMAMNVGLQFNFYLFAVIALVASIVILFIPSNDSNEQM
ncbi:MFS transporter, partial [Heyndrickxia oleronia]